jgi:hypothetical protein
VTTDTEVKCACCKDLGFVQGSGIFEKVICRACGPRINFDVKTWLRKRRDDGLLSGRDYVQSIVHVLFEERRRPVHVTLCADCVGAGHVWHDRRSPMGLQRFKSVCPKCDGRGYAEDLCTLDPDRDWSGSKWRHRNGQVYEIVFLVNLPGDDRYPLTVVYQNIDNGTRWVRRADDWHRSFTGPLVQKTRWELPE